MPALPGVFRMDATYVLAADGRLDATLPARRVPVGNEGALYRRLARLADASDSEIVAAASRYGPLGPVLPLSIPDRPGFILVASRKMRATADRVPSLHRWIATGGEAAVKGRDALAAHVIAAYAEADPPQSRLMVDWLSGETAQLTVADRTRLLATCDVLEELCLTALSRRLGALMDDLEHPERVTLVRPTALASRYLSLAARLFTLLVRTGDERGPASEYVSPNRLGSLGTELAPYLPNGNIVPAESIDGWRTAARLLAPWTRLARFRGHLLPAQRHDVRDALAAQLQRIDAWPIPTDETLGAYARALWSLWPVLGTAYAPRACAWPACAASLPRDAHGNRRFCDDHIRERDRQRAARNRARKMDKP